VSIPADAGEVVSAALLLYEDLEDDLDPSSFQSYYFNNTDLMSASMNEHDYYAVTGGYYAPDPGETGALNDNAILWKGPVVRDGSQIVIEARVLAGVSTPPNQDFSGVVIRASAASGTISSGDFGAVYLDPSNSRLVCRLPGGDTQAAWVPDGMIHDLKVVDDGATIAVYLDDVHQFTVTSSELGTNQYVGFLVRNYSVVRVYSFQVSQQIYTGRLASRELIAVCGGDIYHGDSDGLSLATDGEDVLPPGRTVRMVSAFGKTYFCNGHSSGYLVYDSSDSSVETWEDDEGDGLPVGSSDATAACRIIARYRGRIVLAGLVESPYNWYMSAVGNPNDWNYSPDTVTDTQAVAGNNSDAGELGDVITAIIPYSDDLCVFGGDHTLWMLRGDPAAGGVMDNISYQTGILGPDAFTWDETGVLYFFGVGKFWRMIPGGQPEPISNGRLDSTLASIDPTDKVVRLLWDRDRQACHIFVCPLTEPDSGSQPEHYVWDRRTDSFWKDEFPATIGPVCVSVWDSASPTDRAVLLGGFDSYIRKFSGDSSDDDGTPIQSYVDFTTLTPHGPLANSRLIEIVPIFGQDSGPVALSVFAASTPQSVVESSTPSFKKTITAGRNTSVRQRVNGNAFRVRLERDGTTSGTWSMESMAAILEASGKTRHGRL